MSEKSSGCGCCSECTGEPDCTCGCPDCACGCNTYYDDCCCDSSGSNYVLSAVCSVVGMLLVAVLALLLAVSYLNDAWGFTTIATKDFNVVLAAVSVIMGGVGIFSLKSGDLTEGILFCSIGMLFLVTSASAILGLGMVAYFGWIVMIVVLMVIAILLASHDISFGLAAALFAIGYMFALAFSSSDVLNMVAGLAYLVAGVLFFYIAVSDWVYVETGEDLPLL